MKTFLITTIGLIAVAITCNAQTQWTTSGTNIYNSNTGNVGVGTTSPASKLEVAGGNIAVTGVNYPGFILTSAGGASFALTNRYIENRLSIDFAGTNQLISILSNGNVGIGTTTPTDGLDVIGSIGAIGPVASSRDIYFGSANTTAGLRWILRTNATSEAGGNAGSDFQILPRSDAGSALSTAFTILRSNGNVGVGTTSPNGKLDVNGAILVPGSAGNSVARPVISTARIPGEISGYSTQGLAADDGFLRLSAGGGTNSAERSFIDLTGYSTVPDMLKNIVFGTSGIESMRIVSSGNVGIGTKSPDQKLTVKGAIHSTSVLVDTSVPTPDYVFKSDYKLPALSEIKAYTDKNHHLPGIPAATEIEKNGINLGEMNMALLKKVEELTLYLIEQSNENKKKDTKLQTQQEQINQLKQQLDKLTKALNKN